MRKFLFKILNHTSSIINHKSYGFTLIELIVVISIIGVLVSAVVFVLDPKGQIDKAVDSERKSNLALIQRALEEFNSDNGYYPADNGAGMMDAGGGAIAWGSEWVGYMKVLPQDPNSNKTYFYKSIDTGTERGYVLYTSLDRPNDPDVCNKSDKTKNCDGFTTYSIGSATNYCGTGKICNYGVSSPNLKP